MAPLTFICEEEVGAFWLQEIKREQNISRYMKLLIIVNFFKNKTPFFGLLYHKSQSYKV
jgi:hypothetical protein